MHATPRVAANPADKILDNLDAFAGAVVAVLVSGVFPLSSKQTRQLHQAETALKDSTAEIRKFLASLDAEDIVPEGMFTGFGGLSLSSENGLRAKDEALLADLLDGQEGADLIELQKLPEFTDFGRQLVALDGPAALKGLLDLSVDDVGGLAKALKAAKIKAPALEAPAASQEPPAADPPAAETPADLLAADPAAASTPEA